MADPVLLTLRAAGTCMHRCAHWTRKHGWGCGDGYKAGLCAITGRQTSAIATCASYAERERDLSCWAHLGGDDG